METEEQEMEDELSEQVEEDIILAVAELDLYECYKNELGLESIIVVAGYETMDEIQESCEDAKVKYPLSKILYVFQGKTGTYHDPNTYVGKDRVNN